MSEIWPLEIDIIVKYQVAYLIGEVGLDNSILEGDSEIVINTLRNGVLLYLGLGLLLNDTLSIVNSLKKISFAHTLRQCNAVIDTLARRDRLSSPLLVWMKCIPPDIVNFVNVDLLAP